ncbi:MAG: histidine--tRNA ligase [Candidatus Hadarchaeales archaeon]
MQRAKGTRDLFGRELRAQRRVIEVLSGVFSRYGFREVETPVFEPLELFTLRSGESIVSQLYSFQDKSGNWLALRPELTAPVARLYCERFRSEPKPVKLCYFGSCFRYEEPQAGRWRQFHQAGVEIIGSSLPASDAEVVEMADEAFEELGIRRRLVLGQIAILRETLRRSGVEEVAQDPILRAIDSGEERRLEGELERARVPQEDRTKIKRLVALKGGKGILEQAERLVQDSGVALGALRNLREITELLDEVGVRYELDLGIARGLDYYTGSVFEFYAEQWQVAGGGRYDGLIGLVGGEQVPAVGIGFGIDRISLLLEVEDEPAPDLVVLPAGSGLLKECFKLARDLRRRGLRVEVDLLGRKLGKGLEYASARGAARVVIVGAKDLQHGKVTLRDMRTGEQLLVGLDELAEELKT